MQNLKAKFIANNSSTWLGTEVSTARAINCDNTFVLLVNNDHFKLYNIEKDSLQDLNIAASWEPRWFRDSPNLFYYIAGNELLIYNIIKGPEILVHKFNEYVEYNV